MKVRDDCPQGYSRPELLEIAKQCNIRLTRIAPLKGPKNMKELCEDIKKYKEPKVKGIVHEDCPKGYKREQLVELATSNSIRVTRLAPLKGYKNMVELCDDLKTVKRSSAKRSSAKRSSAKRSAPKRSKIPKDIDVVKREYVDFIQGPYLENNLYGVDSGYEDVNMVEKVKSFFDKGLKADMVIDGRTVFEIFVDSAIEGSRYALDDGGDEVEKIVKLMLKHGGKKIVKKIEDKLIKVTKVNKNDYIDVYMEDYVNDKGIRVVGFLFYFLNTKMSRFYKDWDKLEPSDDQPVSDIGILQMLKFIIQRVPDIKRLYNV